MPIFRFLGKNSRFWESLTKKKKIKGHFQGKTWIFQEFFVRFGNVDENPRFGPKNVDGLFFWWQPCHQHRLARLHLYFTYTVIFDPPNQVEKTP